MHHVSERSVRSCCCTGYLGLCDRRNQGSASRDGIGAVFRQSVGVARGENCLRGGR